MRTPQQGGRARGGPFAGRVLAYDKMTMPVTNNGSTRLSRSQARRPSIKHADEVQQQ